MPTSTALLDALTKMASDLAPLAIIWHFAIAAAALAALAGWRPSERIAGTLLSAPVLSVALVSFAYGNAFNAISFGGLALALAILGDGRMEPHVHHGPPWTEWLGAALIGYGLVYPHFGPWWASPIGVVPCPTLAVVTGAMLVLGGLRSRAIPVLLASWTLFYAGFGIVQLGVWLDVGLLAATAGACALAVFNALGEGVRLRYPQ